MIVSWKAYCLKPGDAELKKRDSKALMDRQKGIDKDTDSLAINETEGEQGQVGQYGVPRGWSNECVTRPTDQPTNRPTERHDHL